MISFEKAKEIGNNACIDKLGREFVEKHADMSSSAYGKTDDGTFCFVGVNENAREYDSSEELILSSKRSNKFEYRVSCNVDMNDGSITFLECVTPKR